MMMIRLCTIVIAAMLASAPPAQAQAYPTKPIHVIVPFAAGGSTDVAARLIGQHLSKAFGQQVVIENRTGANGNVGTEAAAKAEPDGYTLLVAPDSVAANPHVYKVSYDALKDFVPVIQLSVQPIVMAAHPDLGAKTVAELIALAKKQPGIRFATGSGIGSAQHMATAWFAQIAGIDLTQVPYRGGGQAINDLIAGHITLGTLGSTPLIPHYKAGKLLMLAQTTATRSKSLPDVPTFQEAGIKGLVMDQWLGVFVPAGTPPDIVRKLNAEINLALKDKALLDNFDKSALEVVGGSSEQFASRVREDFSKYQKIAKDLNIKAQ
ncbi:MAG: Bug family tripartite tricarboxylate transporter substrate binding protein [Pseudorhodoplanes sp.]|uniref:Bug family tripartite tricarboxylate transporter substrate binding protein n=1 Tax=Pseudorhodoplanes sp. TaxID=1934341 RepID=UPI003D0C2926